jgi:hypothetical protein
MGSKMFLICYGEGLTLRRLDLRGMLTSAAQDFSLHASSLNDGPKTPDLLTCNTLLASVTFDPVPYAQDFDVGSAHEQYVQVES